MNGIVDFALRQRVLILVLLLLVLGAGAVSFAVLNIEAYPDPVPPLVDIVTQKPGQSAEEIERYITIPIEIQMAGIPHVTGDPHDLAVRPVRREGAVHLRLHLRAGRAVGDQPAVRSCRRCPTARSRRSRRPARSARSIRYRVVGPPGYSVTDLKTHRRTGCCERRFKAVPGVIDVTGWGGKTKTYDITIDQRQPAGLRPDAAAGAARR